MDQPRSSTASNSRLLLGIDDAMMVELSTGTVVNNDNDNDNDAFDRTTNECTRDPVVDA
jgi:hypothetical protein